MVRFNARNRTERSAPRCDTCGLLESVCVCREMAPLDLPTKLCLVLHWREIAKTTNSGKIAARCLAGSTVLEHGRRDRPLERPDFGVTQPVLLFPADNATPLSTIEGPVTLVVPDGTWTQAIRMGRRIPWIADLPRVVLPETDTKTTYLLRSSERPGGLGTMEAIARAFGVLEGQAVQRQLEHVFKLFVERTLAARGQQHRIG